MYPRQSSTTHTEQLGDEASVYDWARAQVHALNPTAACVWRRCDGATSRDAIVAAVQRELDLPEARAVVDLTLTQFARLHLLERPVAANGEGPAPTRRWLLGRGVAAALLPAISSIVAPAPVEAQSPGPGAPTLTGIEPDNGNPRSTVAVELRGTNFVGGGRTIVNVSGSGVRAADVVVASATSLTATFVIEAGAAEGPRTVTVTTAGGTSHGQTFRVSLPTSDPGAPTLTSVAPNQGAAGTTVAVTLTGSDFIVGATTVTVSGAGVAVNSVVAGSATSLTATFVIDAAAAVGGRTVTVTTAVGTSGGQTFTITAPAPGGPTLTSVAPNQGTQGTTVPVTLTGTGFVVGATTVNVSGAGVTVNTVVVASATSLTANLVLDAAAAVGARTVTVTTAGGTSGGQTFTINVLHGSQSFAYTGGVQPFTVPPGVTTLTVTARGAQGGSGAASAGGSGGSVTATLTVVPSAVLNVRVGGRGADQAGFSGAGGFNGGGVGGSLLFAGGGGGASDLRSGGDALANRVLVAGGGGGGGTQSAGGVGGGLIGGAGVNSPAPSAVTGGSGGTQAAGGTGGVNPANGSLNGQPGVSGTGGAGGASATFGAGGGGGGYFGGGGGAVDTPSSSGGGGGGSSFAHPTATGVVHTQGDRVGNGEVIISW